MTDAPLLILYTGGTFGMRESERGLVPGGDIERRIHTALATLAPERRASLPEFVVHATPRPIDSSAATPADWQALARTLAAAYDGSLDGRHYAGFIVIHGTDTLAWSAASLAYQLQGIDRPVVVTGSQRPLEAEGSDALANLEAALRFAALPALQEVAVVFGGALRRGVRTRKRDTRAADGFASPNYPLLGELVDGHPVLYPGRGLDDQQRGLPRFELPDYAALGAAPVARLVLWPGITASLAARWLEDDTVQGALLEVWGSGNCPEDPALLEVLAAASGEGKLLAAISQCPQGPVSIGAYAAGRGLSDAGVLSGADMTPEAALTKLVHLTAQPLDAAERRRRFLMSLVGER